MTSYEFAFLAEDMLPVFLPGLISGIPSGAIGIAAYILTSISLYTIAVRRGISHAWLSWIPVLNVWILGSISDQYRYVVKGQYKSKRKILLVLEILKSVLALCAILICGFMVVSLLGGWMHDVEDFPPELIGSLLSVLALCLPLIGVSIAAVVVRYMALYDVFVSCDPANSVLYLVLSVLVGITEPFFLFFNRQKDQGMPPRKEENTDPPLEAELV